MTGFEQQGKPPSEGGEGNFDTFMASGGTAGGNDLGQVHYLPDKAAADAGQGYAAPFIAHEGNPPDVYRGLEGPGDDPFRLRRFDIATATEDDLLHTSDLHRAVVVDMFTKWQAYTDTEDGTEKIDMECEQVRSDGDRHITDTLLITADRTRSTLAVQLKGNSLVHTYYHDDAGNVRTAIGNDQGAHAQPPQEGTHVDRYATYNELERIRRLSTTAHPKTVPFSDLTVLALTHFIDPPAMGPDETKHAAKEFKELFGSMVPSHHTNNDLHYGDSLEVSTTTRGVHDANPNLQFTYEKPAGSEYAVILPGAGELRSISLAAEHITIRFYITGGELRCAYRRQVFTPDRTKPLADTGHLRMHADRALLRAARNAARKPLPA